MECAKNDISGATHYVDSGTCSSLKLQLEPEHNDQQFKPDLFHKRTHFSA